ncbi:MAG TPA: hypothetical protein VJ486_06600 [Geothrix sp.]|nr:hypothetical protein [Geothrix sp.]
MKTSSTHRFRPILRLLALGLLLFGVTRPASAFPIFARKYQTSCVTCHSVFPKLNPFGQAFRLNGYRMPAETEEQIKQRPVSLGSEAYKRVWPAAVWPSELPGNAPVAINIKMAAVNNTTTDQQGVSTLNSHLDFQFPGEVNLFTAGTLGEHMSFLAELTHEEGPDGGSGTEIEHARLDFDSLLGPDHAFNIRLGKFAPNLYDGFQEMWITTDAGIDSLFMYSPFGPKGGNGFFGDDGAAPVISLPARVRGIEIYGVLNHRFFYTAGVSSKIGPGQDAVTNPATSSGNFGNNTHHDVYARIDYKFGGMGLDGDTTGVNLPPENWRENSFRVGLFGLSGNGTNANFLQFDPSGATTFQQQDTSYKRVGLFASWMWGNLNLFGVALHGQDKLNTLVDTSDTAQPFMTKTFDAWFAQADYVLYAPLTLSARLESLRTPDPSVNDNKNFKRGVLSISYLIYANCKAQLEFANDLNPETVDQAYVGKVKTLSAIIRTAF